LDAIKSAPAAEGWGGLMTSAGSIGGVFSQKGLSVVDLLATVGGVGEGEAVRIQAKDGYAMTISAKQLLDGDFTTFDCSSGKEVPHDKLTVIVSYEEDGKPIDPRIGPLRIAILGDKTQVTEGHWWIKWVNRIEIVSVFKPWSLRLEGVVNTDIDSASFQSCSAPKCHGITWQDKSGRKWEGVALWRLVGKVDDAITNRGDVFEDALADRGYRVRLTSADGSTEEFSSAQLKRNNDYVIAYQIDGLPLMENYWPLRLVGPNLDSTSQIGQIGKLQLIMNP
jgi:DMSO/TMAO reductase YedYZ molybdopterin-dependent catalytic subunit